MFISPVNKLTMPEKKAWANYTIYDEGTYYSIFGTGIKGEENPTGYAIALDVAKSTDGVHWEFISRNTIPIAGAHAGYGIKKIDGWFYYYPTCSNSEKGVHFKVYRTKDFKNWEHMGDKYDVAPDRRYYHERWDEVHIISDTDPDGRPVYYGYISSETRDDIGQPGCGLVRSYDGISWEVLPPLVINWGDIPCHHMELNFVEKIDGSYYLSMSGRMYMNSLGYSLFTFKSDSPLGPFRPDAEKFRLSGNSTREVTWLGHSIDTPEGFLGALWLSHDTMPDIPSYTFAIGDLKRIACVDGHLRFEYWQGTDAVKGKEIPVDMHSASMIHPVGKAKHERDSINSAGASAQMSASRDGVIARLPLKADFSKGIVIEGTLRAFENRGHIATHQHAAGAGFFIGGETSHAGTAMICETLGVTRTGAVHWAEERITSYDPYANAGRGLATGRSGELSGTLCFEPEDTVGPLGYASMCGIRHGVCHTFRLMARGDYFVLYIDDIYVQTYLMPENPSGDIGLCCFDGKAEFACIRAWEMNIYTRSTTK